MTSYYENPFFLRFTPIATSDSCVMRVFCYHYGGGSASVFRNWVKDLPKSVEVIGVQLPGREGRYSEPPYNDLFSLLKVLEKAIVPMLDKPFIFFGHSLGGIISFELARLLRAHNHVIPKHLIISGCQAPQLPLRRRKIHQLADDEFLNELSSYKGVPESIISNKELMGIFIPVIRADFTISENYIYSDAPPLACPITVLSGLEDPYVLLEDLEEWGRGKHTSTHFNQFLFEGDHFFLIKEAYPEVISLIVEIIENEAKALKTKRVVAYS